MIKRHYPIRHRLCIVTQSVAPTLAPPVIALIAVIAAVLVTVTPADRAQQTRTTNNNRLFIVDIATNVSLDSTDIYYKALRALSLSASLML